MEDIYVNVDYDKAVTWVPSAVPTGSSRSKWIIHPAVTVFLLLFSLFLLVGLIVLGVHYQSSVSDSSRLSVIRDNLTARLQDAEDELSSLTAERDLLKTNLTEMIKQLQRCPSGWRKFRSSCYLLSTKSASWSEAREDCRNRGGDLVVINDTEEQTFLSTIIIEAPWIGLHDQEVEGTWRWVDGSDVTLRNWGKGEPNNGGEWIQDEDCVYIRDGDRKWNDAECKGDMSWICEGTP